MNAPTAEGFSPELGAGHLSDRALSALRDVLTDGDAAALPSGLRDGDAPSDLARGLAATLIAPMVVVDVHRRVAGASARARVCWTPAASVAVGGPAEPGTGVRPVIVTSPDRFGTQVVRTAHLTQRPVGAQRRTVAAAAVATAVASSPPPTSAGSDGVGPDVLGGPEHLLQVVELTITAPRPDLAPSAAVPPWQHLAPLAPPVQRVVLDGADGAWRVVAADDDHVDPAVTLTLDPWSGDHERDAHDDLVARLRDEAVPAATRPAPPS